jgi:membrane peptidoglycan carboxypeptidase
MNTSRRRGRVSKNHFTTKSGNTIKIHRSISDRLQARKDLRARRSAERLQGLPKSRVKRFLYHFQPSRMYHYWFSRDGGIMALKVMGIGFIAGFLLLVGLFAYFRKDLPNLKDISGNNIGGSIRYYDRTGQTLLWEDYDAVKRIPVHDNEISQNMKNATIAIEDKDFYKHGGFDVRGIGRAAVNDAIGKGGTQGGSTITQQLVKLTQDWSRDRTITRKVKELILAVELERSYSKNEILTGYLNTAPYGGIEYGVEAASRDYFQKPAKDLTLAEAAFLAAIPKSPSHYSPRQPDFATSEAKDDLIARQHYIIDQMKDQGMVSKDDADKAKQIDVVAEVKPPQPKFSGIRAPWFALAAKEQLEQKFGAQTVKRGGWKVTTTVDMALQAMAEDQVNKGLRQIKAQGGDTAAFVAEDVKTGQVVALVGGTDFTNPTFGQNNYAADYKLPPGSSFKPYDYTALIENNNNFGAGSVLYDSQGPLPGYPCTNKALPAQGGNCLSDFDHRSPGPITIRYALGGSRNIPAVKAMLTTGIDKTIATANKMMGNPNGYQCYTDEGLTKPGACYASSAIGDGAYLHLTDHVNGYTTIARNGVQYPQTFILKIEDASNKKVDEWKQPKGDQVVRPDAAYIVSDMISDPNASYFPVGRKPQRYNNGQGTWKFGMKTGTTNDAKDGWMMGFSTQYAAGVWVGYHNRQKVMSGSMENMTLPIWQGWMQGAHKSLKPEDQAKPASVQTLPAYVVRSHVGFGSVEPSPANDLFPSWYQNNKKATNTKQTIDIVSNKLATTCTPDRAKKEVTDTAADTFSGDTFHGTGGANTSEQDDVHKCEDVRPSISLSTQDNGNGTFELTATINQGTHPLSSDKFKGTVTFSAGGQTLPGGTYNIGSPGSVTYHSYSPSGSQSITVTVVDSVLYDASDSKSVTGSSGSSLSNLQRSGGSYSWSGGTGTVTVYKGNSGSGVILCSAAAATGNCSGSPPGGPYSARDSNNTVISGS